ncbi:hypothetical protein [Nocardia gipuzkoensis]|uniref:hypothetical protein n=1 Tax=Nocardia gipuzkoensis TaxID=2749991 RepID=UPI00237D5F13|nr:hypothetical protein [Nocardia gipuzkoensis]MDE1673843.1 hypothetical protein [Nocardia gipuzkoensis]
MAVLSRQSCSDLLRDADYSQSPEQLQRFPDAIREWQRHQLAARGSAPVRNQPDQGRLQTPTTRPASSHAEQRFLGALVRRIGRREDETMGSIRKMSKTELREHERNQHAPEFLEWLARRDAALAAFFAEDAPEIGALPDPWTREGLRLLGANLRARFGDAPAAMKEPENREVVDRYRRYLGEVYCRTVEAEWRNVPFNGPGDPMWPVLAFPFRGLYLDVYQQLYGAFVKSTKKRTVHPDGQIAWVYSNSREDYDDWVSAGRPDRAAWQKLTLERLLASAQEPDM